MINIIVGALLIGMAYQVNNQFSEVLLIQGMLMINLSRYDKKRSLERL